MSLDPAQWDIIKGGWDRAYEIVEPPLSMSSVPILTACIVALMPERKTPLLLSHRLPVADDEGEGGKRTHESKPKDWNCGSGSFRSRRRFLLTCQESRQTRSSQRSQARPHKQGKDKEKLKAK